MRKLLAGPEHGKAYQLSPMSALPVLATTLPLGCNPLQQLPGLQKHFQSTTEKLWSLAARARAPEPAGALPDSKVGSIQTHITCSLRSLGRCLQTYADFSLTSEASNKVAAHWHQCKCLTCMFPFTCAYVALIMVPHGFLSHQCVLRHHLTFNWKVAIFDNMLRLAFGNVQCCFMAIRASQSSACWELKMVDMK